MISLNSIKRPEILSEYQHKLILGFMGSLLVESADIKYNKSLFTDFTSQEDFKTLDKNLYKKISDVDKYTIKAQCKGMARYFMGDYINIKLIGKGGYVPNIDGLDLLSKHYLYPFFLDKRTVSENVLYLWHDLFKNIKIQLIGKGINMYFGKKCCDMYRVDGYNSFTFDYYTNFSRDKLLEKEVELGYVNHTPGVGDPQRGYGYTHLLRANVGEYMTMQAFAINAVMNWTLVNNIITSRKQGKTSFAADRVVAELLSEKRGYGMRRNRSIKLFTDNAAKTGGEVIYFIKQFLGNLVEKKLKDGRMMFDIKESSQKIVCNLTGNQFAIISLHGLKGDSDNSTGDGLACDGAIIEESFRITDRFWKSFTDRAFEECEWILNISTLNEETDISHWCYGEMIKGEAGGFKTHNTIRSSDYDNSVTYFNNFKKFGKSYKEFQKYIDKKLAEKKSETSEEYIVKRLLCGILSEGKLFDINNRIASHNNEATDNDFRVIGLDMGGMEDPLGICIVNLTRLIVEEGYSMKLSNYREIPVIAEEFKNTYRSCIIVGDRGGPVGEAVATYDKEHGGFIDYWIKSTGNQAEVSDKGDYFTMTKASQILGGAYVLQNIIKVLFTCSELITQFGEMKATKSKKSSLILYKGEKKKKDDVVFAFLLIFSLLRQIFKLETIEDMLEFAELNKGNKIVRYSASDEHIPVEYYNHGGFNY